MRAMSITEGEAEDSVLVRRLARRDVQALRTLYDRHGGLAMAIALRVLGNRADAEELVQETFIEVWRRAADFDERRGTVGAWLSTIARTRAIDRLRAAGSAARVSDAVASLPAAPIPSPADLASRNEAGATLRSGLATLPAEQRTAIELAYFEGLSQREIAERTGEPLGTVKTRVRLAMEKLSTFLTGQGLVGGEP